MLWDQISQPSLLSPISAASKNAHENSLVICSSIHSPIRSFHEEALALRIPCHRLVFLLLFVHRMLGLLDVVCLLRLFVMRCLFLYRFFPVSLSLPITIWGLCLSGCSESTDSYPDSEANEGWTSIAYGTGVGAGGGTPQVPGSAQTTPSAETNEVDASGGLL